MSRRKYRHGERKRKGQARRARRVTRALARTSVGRFHQIAEDMKETQAAMADLAAWLKRRAP